MQHEEPALDPERDIVDAHHHLWDRPQTSGRFLLPDLLEDIARSGHRVSQTIYVQARSMYRTDGPEELKPVGEVEFAAQVADDSSGAVQACVAIVGCADLTLGDRVRPVLDRMIEAGKGRLRGIRFPVAFHADPGVRSTPGLAPPGVLLDPGFREGARQVAAAGLSLDVWAYQTQLDEVAALAGAIPGLAVVVDHAGGPLGVGPYAGQRGRAERDCLTGLARLAALPNVSVKIGGLAMAISGFGFHQAGTPPDSEVLARAWKPMFEGCLASFGPERCMLESNFPVDKGMVGYGPLWNAFKRLAAPLGEADRAMLFSGTARRIYRIDPPHRGS